MHAGFGSKLDKNAYYGTYRTWLQLCRDYDIPHDRKILESYIRLLPVFMEDDAKKAKMTEAIEETAKFFVDDEALQNSQNETTHTRKAVDNEEWRAFTGALTADGIPFRGNTKSGADGIDPNLKNPSAGFTAF